MIIWIFECNDETQFECFAIDLFGAKARWPMEVRRNDTCLLYNYTQGGEHSIFGVFRAISYGSLAMEPKAWGGSYPFQVRVKLVSKERMAVPRFNIKRLITTVTPRGPRVRHKVFGDDAQELLQFYAASYTRGVERGEELRLLDDDFRLQYPRRHLCVDGHQVRSLSEQAIDDWFSRNHVYHEYERLANIPEQMIPDFTVYTLDHRPVFIEFWGLLDDPVYKNRRLKKSEAYHRHRCKLIEIYPDDLKNLDFTLSKKLRDFGVSVGGA